MSVMRVSFNFFFESVPFLVILFFASPLIFYSPLFLFSSPSSSLSFLFSGLLSFLFFCPFYFSGMGCLSREADPLLSGSFIGAEVRMGRGG